MWTSSFSDIVMPGEMNGYELACWARETRLELKCLLTTGADDSQRSRADQSIPMLRKPYTEKMLRDTIRSLFHQGERI
jgi:two-component system NtrC family sensor kinase